MSVLIYLSDLSLCVCNDTTNSPKKMNTVWNVKYFANEVTSELFQAQLMLTIIML